MILRPEIKLILVLLLLALMQATEILVDLSIKLLLLGFRDLLLRSGQ